MAENVGLLHLLNGRTILALATQSLVLADRAASAVLARASHSIVLTDRTASAVLARAAHSLVLADLAVSAVLAPGAASLVLADFAASTFLAPGAASLVLTMISLSFVDDCDGSNGRSSAVTYRCVYSIRHSFYYPIVSAFLWGNRQSSMKPRL